MRLDFQHVRWFVVLGLGMTVSLVNLPTGMAAESESSTRTNSEACQPAGRLGWPITAVVCGRMTGTHERYRRPIGVWRAR